MLQPFSMDFVNPLATKADQNNVQPPLGPEPPAPMTSMMIPALIAPMGSVETMEIDMDSIQQSIVPTNAETKGLGDESQQPEQMSDKKEEETDEDQIAYEPVKPTSRTPRSTRSRANPSSRPKTSSRLAEPELPNGKSPSRKSARKRREPSKSKSPEPSQVSEVPSLLEAEKHHLLAVPIARAVSASSGLSGAPQAIKTPTPEPATAKEPAKLDFEVVINPISQDVAKEYTKIAPGDEIYRVLERIPTGIPGETWLSVEFEDGRIDQVSPCGFWTLPFDFQ